MVQRERRTHATEADAGGVLAVAREARRQSADGIEEALPQLIEMDALLIPSTLCYEVPAVPKGMFEKALWYVDHQKTHVKLTRDVLGEPALYFLAKDSEFKSLTAKHMEMYEEALQGVEDRRIVDEDHLRDVCSSLHYVSAYTDLYGLCECYANPGRWVCDCKGNKNYGICSHVLATDHILHRASTSVRS